MPITTSDIKWKLSTKAGSAGNSQAQATPAASLGKYVSITEWAGGVTGDLFGALGGTENAALASDYRCVFVHNSHATLTFESPVVWISGVRGAADAGTDVITSTAHGFVDGDEVRVEAEYGTDAVPTGLTAGVTYYVRDATSNTFKLAASAGGSAIDLSTSTTLAIRRHTGATEAIGVDPTAASAVGSGSAQAVEAATTATAPAGVTFSSPTTKATGLSVGSLTPGQVRAIWIRRTATNSAARNNDGCILVCEGDTAQ